MENATINFPTDPQGDPAGLTKIDWYQIPDHNPRSHLTGNMFSIWRSEKGRGVTFSNDLTVKIREINGNRLLVGKTVTGHIVLQFGAKGAPISIKEHNAKPYGKALTDLIIKLLEIKETTFRKVYRLRQPGTEPGLYFIEGEVKD